ncbi:MAG: hypothetical protein HUK05_08710, partial [Prevotella sp.]|nr:hypothetical protein [Prevotella sp.]MCF0193469.1 hypothetical protein [Prevotella sp.]
QPKETFTKTLTDWYDAKSFIVDFTNPSVVNNVNDWCKEQTKGLIPDMYSKIDPGTALILLNAIYFKSAWEKKFDKSATKAGDFTLSNGTKVQPNFMNRVSKENAFDGSSMTMVMLPMGEIKRYYTFFALPKEGKTLADAANGVKEALQKYPANWESTEMNMSIPKFQIKNNNKLDTMLQDMGLTLPFDPKASNFSKMTDLGAYISELRQACTFSLNEDEVEASAATGASFYLTSNFSSGMNFHLDRPFLFGLYEVNTGTLLFVGAVENPC